MSKTSSFRNSKKEVKPDLQRNDEYKLAKEKRIALKRQKVDSNTKCLEAKFVSDFND